MTDIDQSSATARRPYRQNGDSTPSPRSDKRLSAWSRLRAMLNFRSPSLRDDLQDALDEQDPVEEASFSASERTILKNVLKLGDMRVDDVMVPRADIEAVDAEISIGHLVAKFRTIGHSRMPVFEENLDNVIGMVHIKDVLNAITEPVAANGAGPSNGNGTAAPPIKLLSQALRQGIGKRELVRKLLFVPPSMPVVDLLQSMQAARIHMAVVVDEYGGTDGLVTIEDLLEAVVGDIEDEHDESESPMLRALDADTFIATARIELGELAQAIGPDFEPGEYGEEVDTLGGLLVALEGRVPVRGEVISKIDGFDFEILRADPRRVRQVRIIRRERETQALDGPSKVVRLLAPPDAAPEDTAETLPRADNAAP